ncbi:MAG TPA: hypothetical protein VLB44_13990 [Kofleriaceae bacterium]|nr:hypothetical protein [Kofleriaceae bacterium]
MRLVVLLAILGAGCYRAPTTDEGCTITCMDAICPGDLTCRGGYCVSGDQVCRPLFGHVAAGTGFACALDESGARWCWGSNQHHEISPTEQLQYPSATRLDPTQLWQQIDAGGEHICGISDGRLFCWGKNDHGQVSDTVGGDITAPLEITVVGGPSAWTTVSAGMETTCAIGDRKLFCWGANNNGQLGDGTQTDRGVPTQIAPTIADWIAVSTGFHHTCAVSEGSGVHCWGENFYGQSGPGASDPQLTPNPVKDSAGQPTFATSIAVSANSVCATTREGGVVCWGGNSASELGELQFGQPASPVPVSATASMGWTSLSASRTTFCGVRSGETVCWGTTSFGGLGNGYWSQNANDRVFATVFGTFGTSEVSVGWDTNDVTLACSVVGTDVYCWGDDRFGQLGIGAATMALAPAPLRGDHVLTDLGLGLDHGCGIEDGNVLCWGSTEFGAATGVLAGNPQKECNPNLDCDVPEPKTLGFFSPTATKLGLGAYHTCAFHSPTITCWGDNRANQLVTTSTPPPRERDVAAPGGAMWTQILQTGRLGQCGIYRVGTTDSTACWGNVLMARTTVTQVPSFDGARGIALGSTGGNTNYDCILDATGTLQCQGDNAVGEYGNGTTNPVTTLATVTPARVYTAIATNTLSPTMCGIRPDAQVECWGYNDRGQTGAPPSTTGTLTPNILPGLSACTGIAVGREHACAICSGAISCWGDNRVGELGTGVLDVDPITVPRLVADPPAGESWAQIVAGLHFTCARTDAGHTLCWGFDPHAGLGNGGRSANLPVVVQALPAR